MYDPHILVFSVDSRVVVLYQIVAPIAAFVTGYTWWRTRRDLACLLNSLTVRMIRSLFLLGTSASLCVSAICFSIEAVLVTVLIGFVNMAVNAYALRQRENYSNGTGATSVDVWTQNYPPTFLQPPSDQECSALPSVVVNFSRRSVYPRLLQQGAHEG
jgi:hypothetical protein